MSASVYAFPRRDKRPQPWSNEELADLYRVVDLLGRAGLSVTTDMGLSDEGDPWFIFCRVDNGEVIAHFARIDGMFIAVSIVVDETFRGANFRQIVDRMVSSQPLIVPSVQTSSRLLLHPAVMLTAFVATALAHSEKMKALDILHSVEAQWDHAKTSVHEEIKHAKTSWAETLHNLFKMPLGDQRLGHDAGKEASTFTLASLIAIAMTALQPIASEIANIIHLMRDELADHGVAFGATGGPQPVKGELPGLAALDDGSHASGGAARHDAGTHDGDAGPQQHKLTNADFAATDAQKLAVEAARALAVPAVTKDAVAGDDGQHVARIDTQPGPEANSAFLQIQQQKVAALATAAATQTAENFIIHLDPGLGATQTIAITDVTPEALKILNINLKNVADGGAPASHDATATASLGLDSQPPVATAVDGAATTHTAVDPASPATSPSGATPSGSSAGTGAAGPAVASADSGSASQINATHPAVTPPVTDPTPDLATSPSVQTPSGPLVVDTNADPTGSVAAISKFTNTASHVVTQQSLISNSATLGQELQNFFTPGTSSLKVVFFESSAPITDIFSFTTGVVFVAEKDVSPSAPLTNAGGNLILDVAGGTVTLVGVATIEHTPASV